MEQPLPDTQFIVRVANKFTGKDSSSSFCVRESPFTPESLAATKSNALSECSEEGWIRYSPDGAYFAVISNLSVEVHVANQPDQVSMKLDVGGVCDIDWSPRGTFLVTWEKKAQDENLIIWNATTGEAVRKFFLKDVKKDESWPVAQWTNDEELLCHLTTNQVVVYNGHDCVSKLGAIIQKGVMNYRVAPSISPYHIATFTPVTKSSEPAKVCIFAYPNLETPTATKTFFNADSAKILWSPLGTAALIKSYIEVDTTGESYDGRSALYYLTADGTQSVMVPFGSNKGHVHDAQWSPDGKDFITIQGMQPAQILLFNKNCTAVRDFGNASRNTVIWSPHGRFVCIAGFGNLAGEMDFWEKQKFKLLGSCQDLNGAKSYEWTPDSRYFVSSVLWPKRRVDNGIKIWTYYGDLVYHEKVERLAQVQLRPRPGVYPNLPVSPRLNDRKIQEEVMKQREEAKPKAYVPPHMRGKPSSEQGTTAQLMRREVSAPKKLQIVEDSLDDAAEKAKKKEREKARKERKKKEVEEAEKKRLEEEARKAQEKKEQELSEKAAIRQPKQIDTNDEDSINRKLKALRKKMEQIKKLEEQAANGKALDPSQKEKLVSAAQTSQEILEMETALRSLQLSAGL